MPVSCEGCEKVTTNEYDRILKEPRERIWPEGGFTVAGDAEWVSVTIQLADFNDAVVFVSLPAIPGDTSNDVLNLALPLLLECSMFFHHLARCPLMPHYTKPMTIFTLAPISPGVSLSWLIIEKGAYDLDDGKSFMIGSGPISREDADVTNSNNFQRFNFPTSCDLPAIPVCY